MDIAETFIDNIEKDNINTIVKNPKIYTQIEDRNTLSEVLKYMLIKYNNNLNYLIKHDKIKDEVLKNNDLVLLSKKILIINENLNKLSGNLNKNLSIDRLLIEMWRCNNENS